MDPFAKPKASQHSNSSSVNPFAKALAETERSFTDNKPQTTNNPFSEALARTGGKFSDYAGGDNQADQSNHLNQQDPDALARQQEEMRKQQQKEMLRKKLHDQINPVNQQDVFDAREEQVVKELEKTRQELKMLAKEIAAFRMDIDIAAMKQVVKPGTSGKYYVSFFQQLRQFIMLLRAHVQSARTWAQQMHTKSAKKKAKRGKQPGLEIGGAKHEQTKSVFDIMHHERSSSYSGS